MRGQQHVQISLLTGLIITIPFLLTDLVLSILYLAGLFFGSLLPDSDASDRTAKHHGPILFIFDKINEYFIYPALRISFHEKRKHRGILHTILGVFTFSLILTLITGITFSLILPLITGSPFPVWGIRLNLAIFGVGLFAGGILHLMEDCCTCSGVNPFYPKCKDSVFKGNIVTFDKKERRPGLFTHYLAVLFIVFIFLMVYYGISQPEMIVLVLTAVLISWAGFLLACGVRRE